MATQAAPGWDAMEDAMAHVLDPARGDSARAAVSSRVAAVDARHVLATVETWRHFPLETPARGLLGMGRPVARWRAFVPADVDALAGMSNATGVLCVLAHHHDGHVRERSLRLLPRVPGTLPWVLPRLADHVPQVRAAAATAVDALRGHLPPSTLVTCVGLTAQLRQRARVHPLLNTLAHDALQPSCRAELLRSLDSPWPLLRRECARLLAQAGEPTLAERLLGSMDVVLRRTGMELLLAGPGDHAGKVLRGLVHSRSGRVRRISLDWLIQHPPADLRDLLVRALWDRDDRVRALAQWHTADLDPADLYRSGLARNPSVAARGLGETGAVADAVLLLPLLAHADAGVRASALAGLCALDAEAALPHLVAALADTSPSVVATAVRLLQRLRRVPPPAELWPLISNAGSTRGLLLGLAARGSHWGALVVLLRAWTTLEDPRVEVLLRRWLGRSTRVFTRPTRDEELAIRVLARDPLVPAWLQSEVLLVL